MFRSLKATVLDQNLKTFATEVVNFDDELPHYKTKGGVHRDPLVDGRIVSPPLMWVEALDLLLQKLEKSQFDFGRVLAVSGSAQQHGSVYWKKGSSVVLGSLDSERPLAAQLGGAFSAEESPVWMDCSTTRQCRAIEDAVGGALELSRLTGSCAHERYAGPQIRKIFETQPEVYENTERVSLISSFMASLLIGGYACIDHTDGAGMNLMDIKSKSWSKIALEVCVMHDVFDFSSYFCDVKAIGSLLMLVFFDFSGRSPGFGEETWRFSSSTCCCWFLIELFRAKVGNYPIHSLLNSP